MNILLGVGLMKYMVSLFLQFHSSVLYRYHSYTPGESHGQRSLAGYSPWGHKESDTLGKSLLYFEPLLPKM